MIKTLPAKHGVYTYDDYCSTLLVAIIFLLNCFSFHCLLNHVLSIKICEHSRLPKLGLICLGHFGYFDYFHISGSYFWCYLCCLGYMCSPVLVWVFMHLSCFGYFNMFCPWTICSFNRNAKARLWKSMRVKCGWKESNVAELWDSGTKCGIVPPNVR